MIEFVSRTGAGAVHHEAYFKGRLLWSGDNPADIFDLDGFELWPSGEALELHKYLARNVDVFVTVEWFLSEKNGVHGIAIVEDAHIDFYGTIFSFFESGALGQIKRG